MNELGLCLFLMGSNNCHPWSSHNLSQLLCYFYIYVKFGNNRDIYGFWTYGISGYTINCEFCATKWMNNRRCGILNWIQLMRLAYCWWAWTNAFVNCCDMCIFQRSNIYLEQLIELTLTSRVRERKREKPHHKTIRKIIAIETHSSTRKKIIYV